MITLSGWGTITNLLINDYAMTEEAKFIEAASCACVQRILLSALKIALLIANTLLALLPDINIQ